jgi:hypothetical protein
LSKGGELRKTRARCSCFGHDLYRCDFIIIAAQRLRRLIIARVPRVGEIKRSRKRDELYDCSSSCKKRRASNEKAYSVGVRFRGDWVIVGA